MTNNYWFFIATALFVITTIYFINRIRDKKAFSIKQFYLSAGLVTLMAIGVFQAYLTYQKESQVDNVEYIKAQLATIPSSVINHTTKDTYSGQLSKDKNTLINQIRTFDPTLGEFSQKPVYNNYPLYEGTDKLNSTIKIIGNELEVKEVMWTYSPPKTGKPDKAILTNMIAFTGLLCNSKGIEWVNKELKKESSVSIEETIRIEDIKITFFNLPESKITLKISTEIR